MKLKNKIARKIKKQAFFINNWNIEEGSKPGTYSINLTIDNTQDYDLVVEKLKTKNYDFDIISQEDIKIKDIPSSNSLNALNKLDKEILKDLYEKEASVNKKAEGEVDEFADLPTSLKEQTSRPDKFIFTDTDIKPAEGELLGKLQELDRLKSAKAALDAQLKQIEENYRQQVELAKQEGKEIENKVQTDNILNEIAKLAKATNAKVISYGDKLITLKEETKKQPFKPTPLWKINKLLEKFGEQAKEYLDKAIDGAQNMATTSKIKQLIMWKDTRKKTSAVEDNALLNELKDLYIDMKNLYVNVAKADQVVDQVI